MAKRLNVLLYNGPGVYSFQQILTASLRSHLSSSYDIIVTNEKQLSTEPWEESCALLVMPGGSDLPYIKALSPVGTRKIKEFVVNGGSYLGTHFIFKEGLCAGACFGCKRVEWEVGSPMEVVGDRDLGFFNGVACGSVSGNFLYHSELGAKAIPVISDTLGHQVASFYVNGGTYFKETERSGQHTVIGRYYDSGLASIVECNYGKGKAILSGPHIELAIEYYIEAASELEEIQKEHTKKIIPILKESEHLRDQLWRDVLRRLGLKLNDILTSNLSPTMWFASCQPSKSQTFLDKLKKNVCGSSSKGSYLLVDDVDTWNIYEVDQKPEPKKINNTTEIIEESNIKPISQKKGIDLRFFNENIVKQKFDITLYLSKIQEFALKYLKKEPIFGSSLIYSEIITSTQTIIDKYFFVFFNLRNSYFGSSLESGTVVLANFQTSGRGIYIQ